MAESRHVTDDLRAFFVWKSSVDDRRNSLVELGLLQIDALTNTGETSSVVQVEDEDDDILLEEPFPQLVKHQLENLSLAMSYISTLEDRVSDVFSRIENLHFQDDNSIDAVEGLIEYLKVDLERFGQISSHTKHVLDSFKSLKDSIKHAENLLIQKKQ